MPFAWYGRCKHNVVKSNTGMVPTLIGHSLFPFLPVCIIGSQAVEAQLWIHHGISMHACECDMQT